MKLVLVIGFSSFGKGMTRWSTDRDQLFCQCFRFRLSNDQALRSVKESTDREQRFFQCFLYCGNARRKKMPGTNIWPRAGESGDRHRFSCFGPAGSTLFDNLQVPGYCSNIKLPWSAKTELCRFWMCQGASLESCLLSHSRSLRSAGWKKSEKRVPRGCHCQEPGHQ